jgi:mannose-6-phosphate isomerase-like protein (cupin superfamily)
MAMILEGGCRVTDMHEGLPAARGTLRIWPQIGRKTGAQAISLRVLEFASGLSPGLRNESCDEILYVLGPGRSQDRERPAHSLVNDEENQNKSSNDVTIYIDGSPYSVGPATGIYLRPTQTLTVDNPSNDPLVVISSRCPEPDDEIFGTTPPITTPTVSASLEEPAPIVRLADRPAQPTGDRWYRVLVDDQVGSTQVTQFVGSIPPGRAPDHFHHYEEVLFVLRGDGRMWAGKSHKPIAAGSCVYLPKGQVHCVENSGPGELRVLGVFYPAGSPSVRYDVD